MRNKIIIVLAVLAIFILHTAVFSQEKTKIAGSRLKIVSGEVSGIGRDFIAVVYNRDEAKGTEEEIALPIAKDVILEHRKSLEQIAVGDLVDVQFEDVKEETKEGTKTKRIARVITFVKAALPAKPESSVLVSGTSREEEE